MILYLINFAFYLTPNAIYFDEGRSCFSCLSFIITQTIQAPECYLILFSYSTPQQHESTLQNCNYTRMSCFVPTLVKKFKAHLLQVKCHLITHASNEPDNKRNFQNSCNSNAQVFCVNCNYRTNACAPLFRPPPTEIEKIALVTVVKLLAIRVISKRTSSTGLDGWIPVHQVDSPILKIVT